MLDAPMLYVPTLSRRMALAGLGLGLIRPWAAMAAPSEGAGDVAWLDRLTWGVNAPGLAELQRQGRAAWLARQLRPGPPAPLAAPVQAQIDQMLISREPFEQLVSRMESLRQDRKPAKAARAATMAGPDIARMDGAKPRPDATSRAFRDLTQQLLHENATRSLLRAMHAPDQLREQMTWFWYNHFNVLGHGHNLPGLIGHYEDQAIRPRALGRFRDLLGAVATHPAMLVYLNNDRNIAGQINENYARELMELHTLGVDGGYTQADVLSLARVLTGLGVHLQPGQRALAPGEVSFTQDTARFLPARHEPGEKLLLGQRVQGQGWAEIEHTLDLLAAHPSTARHIARKLARYLVADEPSPELVASLARRFTDSGGDIAAVLATLIESPEFTASLDRKFKDPIHYLVSALRLAYPEPRALAEPMAAMRWLDRMGQRPYGRATPDGYPLTASDWNGSGQMSARFEVARALSTGAHALFGEGGADKGSRPRLDNAFYRDHLAPSLGAATLAALRDARAPADWNAVLLSSPEFMTR